MLLNLIFKVFFLKVSNGKLESQPLKALQTELSDFYMTNSIARASSTMAKCVKSFEETKQNKKQNSFGHEKQIFD